MSQRRCLECGMQLNVILWQDGLTGSAWGDWANYTASPLRAFENELGVQAPTGFWDPAGFTADGSVENFQRRRQTELKHGRISMLATMGYITPEIFVWQEESVEVCLLVGLFVCFLCLARLCLGGSAVFHYVFVLSCFLCASLFRTFVLF